MALNNTTADAMVTSMAAAMGITDAATISKMKSQFRVLYTALKTDIVITILSGSIATTGSATSQAGPAAPIPLSPG